MLVQPSKLHKQLPNSAELRAQPPLVGTQRTQHAARVITPHIGACAAKCAAQAPFQRHLMASKGKAPVKASSTRVHGSTSQQQPSLEIRLYESPAHEERGKILEERKALHERIMRRQEQLMLMLHPGLDTSGFEQIPSPDISQNLQGQRAGSAEKENAEEDDDFQSAEATGDASTYAREESADDEQIMSGLAEQHFKLGAQRTVHILSVG
ncbi:hypothetical protein PIB30_083644 [Stylosanthes scabra]|uniref:Uncharacterized protein n=1 Tax=Stylosanthes scabra TaxID=79078 RepID=A0ABU6YT44_9FABA|nr:hypothetical protein [Stylosanthes scabra]